MKKAITVLFILTLLCQEAFAQKEEKAIEAAVVGFFNGLSLLNTDTLKYYATNDFQLLEDGEVWNMDTLISKMQPMKGRNITRVNQFNFVKHSFNGKTAWASYYNTAEFAMGENRQKVQWLESVVLENSSGRWKIQMMHSTKLKPPATAK